jgi:hypothetical protein
MTRVLYVITCGNGSATRVYDFIEAAQRRGWDVCSVLTPSGREFVDSDRLAQLTGHPVRSEYKHPGDSDVLPTADAIVVFPATFNTINKWAMGISDTLAVGLLSEYTGRKKPIIAVPCFKTGGGLDTNPAFSRSVHWLREAGVRVIYEPDLYPPRNWVPPEVTLDLLDELMQQSGA